jgi:hypothetical protein
MSVLRDQRPARKVTAMFIDMAFSSPIYERLRAVVHRFKRLRHSGVPH